MEKHNRSFDTFKNYLEKQQKSTDKQTRNRYKPAAKFIRDFGPY